MIKCSCKGCTDRTIGCHDKCTSYQDYIVECERIKQNKLDEKIYYSYVAHTKMKYEKDKFKNSFGIHI